jgi:hypothetical protein
MANALQAVLNQAALEDAPKPAAVRKAPKPANKTKQELKAASLDIVGDTMAQMPPLPVKERKFQRPSRDNRRFIGGHFEPAVGKQLKMIAVEDDTTVQALLEEALDLLFMKKGRQKVADLSK